MSGFKFKLPKKLYGRKGISPILTNYGCAGFHFCDFDDDKLLDLYPQYTSKEERMKLEKIFKNEGKDWVIYELKKSSYSHALSRIIDDYPDVIAGGLIQVVLTSVPLEIDYGFHDFQWQIKMLERNIKLLKALSQLDEKFDIETEYEYVEFEKDEDAKKRLTIYINDFWFDSNESLEDVEARIDKVISPLKKYLEKEPRTDLLLMR